MDLLIVEDDDDFRTTATAWMARKGHRIAEARDGQSAFAQAKQRRFDVAILDLNLPDTSGIELFQQLRGLSDEIEVLILTGEATVEVAVEAMKLGACDFLSKPFPLAELEERCQKAAERGRLRRDGLRWKTLAERNQQRPILIGESPAMREVFRLIDRVGPTDAPVLVEGETGTGKELAARAIQRVSRRADQPFVIVNCAALPEQLVESELFGHEKGAFTGAQTVRPGLFEIADEGTLFIDEIGELPLALQPKLLRVLEDGSLRRIGSSQERRVDVRIIAATNRNLVEEVRAGRFREDLLYRINVMRITMPSLRSHAADISLLIRHFLASDWTVEAEAEAAMIAYAWPGNVRQLRNVLERATILAEDRTITIDDLPSEIASDVESNFNSGAAPGFREALQPSQRYDGAAGVEGYPVLQTAPQPTAAETQLESIERAHVLEVLQRCQGNKTHAAQLLGIHRRKLYRLIDRLGISNDPDEGRLS